MVSDWFVEVLSVTENQVLILVLMEDGLWRVLNLNQIIKHGKS